MTKEERLDKLDKREKLYKVLKWALLILSIAVSVTPAIFVALRVAPSFPKVKTGVAIATFAAFIIALGLIFVVRGLEKRYAHNLPWATTTLIWSWVLYLVIFSLKRIIVPAEQISLALAIGVSVSFVLSLASDLCGVLASSAAEDYKRLK